MTTIEAAALDTHLTRLARELLNRRNADGYWEGYLASSALSTGTAVLALHLAASHRSSLRLARYVRAGARWLIEHQHADGGWGDTVRSGSSISTTAIVWAALSVVAARDADAAAALGRAEGWLRAAAGDLTPAALRTAILRRYGKDRTFSVPILTVLALAGKLGPSPATAWRSVPQLPFELAVLPHRWFHHLRLPVVSYALPALIAIGNLRHRLAPSRNPLTRLLRNGVRDRTLHVLRDMQPESGGYLEAIPLTSFVIMSLVGAGLVDTPVMDTGVNFLLASMREDGSWPIDTNLATWVTTLSVGALGAAGALSREDRQAIGDWLVRWQSVHEHPFTHAAPGGWAWTPLSGGVPDADDTSGALIALRALREADSTTVRAAVAGLRWLLGIQNRDGGVPTFCRGWGTLPFDRSTPEITAHAMRAWSAWHACVDGALRRDLEAAATRAMTYLEGSQRRDGSWIPLWFGNEHAAQEHNPAYGTARVVLALGVPLLATDPRADRCRRGGLDWLLRSQNDDGGWGGERGVRSSIEETGVVLSALRSASSLEDRGRITQAVDSGTGWILRALGEEPPMASPVGLYFARLWYYEELYPLVFALEGLAGARASEGMRARWCERKL